MYHEELTIPAPNEDQSAPEARTENLPSKETYAAFINPVSARIAAEAVKKSAFNPDATLDPKNEELKERYTDWFSNKAKEHMNFPPVEALADDSRRTTTEKRRKELEAEAQQEGKPKTHEELKRKMHDEWNEDMRGWIKHMAKTSDRDETLAALNALGMKIDENDIQGDLSEDQEKALEAKVNTFYDSYLKDRTNIKKFVFDIAEDLKENDHVDLAKLDKRLTAVQGLLTTFGDEMKDENGNIVPIEINRLVDGYARKYGILTQDKASKKVAAEATLDHLSQPVPEGPDRQLFIALNKKNEELKATTPETPQTAQPSEQPSQPAPDIQPAPPDNRFPEPPPPGEAEAIHTEPTRTVEDVPLEIQQGQDGATTDQEPAIAPETTDIDTGAIEAQQSVDDERKEPQQAADHTEETPTERVPTEEQSPTADDGEKQVDETQPGYQVSVAPINTEEAPAPEAKTPTNQLPYKPDNGPFINFPDTTGVSVKADQSSETELANATPTEDSPEDIEVGQDIQFMDFKGKVTEVKKNGKILAEFEGEKGKFNYEIDLNNNKLTILPKEENT